MVLKQILFVAVCGGSFSYNTNINPKFNYPGISLTISLFQVDYKFNPEAPPIMVTEAPAPEINFTDSSNNKSSYPQDLNLTEDNVVEYVPVRI